jgi:glycosyltransferase involved in cell wall biosynthesis
VGAGVRKPSVLRILLVSSGSGSRGGGEIFLDYLGKGLRERGHEILMWIPAHPRMDELAGKCMRFSQRVIRGDYRNTYDRMGRTLSTSFNWGVSRRVAREWIALRPDVVHLNKQNLEDGLDLLRALEQSKLPNVCTIHLTQTARYLRARAAWLRDWIARRTLTRYHGTLIAVQEQRRAMLTEFVGGHVRTAAVYNGVPVSDMASLRSLRQAKRLELGLSDENLLVLGIGRLVRQKRPLQFLRFARELHARIPSARFVWVGDGELAGKWSDAILRDQLNGIVSCVGWQADVRPFLAAGDLLLHVAKFEGLPFVVIEAMAAGLACAVTRDLRSEVPIFDLSNVLEADDVLKLAQQLRTPHVMANASEGGRRLVQEKLSIDQMVRSYEALYVDAVESMSAQ